VGADGGVVSAATVVAGIDVLVVVEASADVAGAADESVTVVVVNDAVVEDDAPMDAAPAATVVPLVDVTDAEGGPEPFDPQAAATMDSTAATPTHAIRFVPRMDET